MNVKFSDEEIARMIADSARRRSDFASSSGATTYMV
jgi:hypothetical protein